MSRCPRLGAPTSLAFGVGCGATALEQPAVGAEGFHGQKASPGDGTVFAQDQVERFALVLPPEDWQVRQEDMTGMLGASGSGANMGGIHTVMHPRDACDARAHDDSLPSLLGTSPAVESSVRGASGRLNFAARRQAEVTAALGAQP